MSEIKQSAQRLRSSVKKLKVLEQKTQEQKNLVTVLRDEMTKEMNDAGTVSYSGPGIRISLRKSIVPQAVDWTKIYRFMKKNNAFDLLQRRLASTAWNDRMEDRKSPIPGIESFTKTTLYITLAED